MSARLYCYRVGGPVVLNERGKCPECGSDEHDPIPEDMCGVWTKGKDTELGTWCELEPGHNGAHFTTLSAVDDEESEELAALARGGGDK